MMLKSKKLKVPWAPPDISKEEKNAVNRVLKSNWLSQGSVTETLEKKISKFVKTKYAVMINNGTSALVCSLIANEIGPGDEVIVPTFTFVATVNAILAVGAKPVLVDSDPYTFNTNPELVKSKLSRKTKAVIPVDVSGMSIDIDSFREFSNKNNLILIEDAAEGLGGEYKNRLIGSFGHTTVFSFHMAKVVAGIEGGCIVTNDRKIASIAKLVRSHGDAGKYDFRVFGLNFRISDVHSAIIFEQLKKINRFLDHRNKLAKIYKEELSNYDFQEIPSFVTLHPYMLFALLISPKKCNKLNKFLNRNGVDTRKCWPPIHKQMFHSKLFRKNKFNSAEKIYTRIINLPMGNGLSKDEVMYVVELVKKGMKQI